MKKEMGTSRSLSDGKFLGDFVLPKASFADLDEVFKEFQSAEFKKLGDRQKNERINRNLLNLIQREDGSSFLLIPIIEYFDRIQHEGIHEHYGFSNFEMWLNQFSELTPEENYDVRARIIGKTIPREEYQRIFPIGMGKTHPGSHFVTAHNSPDLDTTIASFWGWVDAFGCKVAEGVHLWNVPGGPPMSQSEIQLLFLDIFGQGVFNHLAKTRTSLAVSSLDLVSQTGLMKRQREESTQGIDHERNQNAIILVDEQGYYLGDWRPLDAEGVNQVIMLLNSCLRWFENFLHAKIISLFAKEDLKAQDFSEFINSSFNMRLMDCEPAKEFNEKQKRHIEDYLTKVLGVKEGLSSTFREFATSMQGLSLYEFQEFLQMIQSHQQEALFDRSGSLLENRPRIFNFLEKIIQGLDRAIYTMRRYVERLDVALNIKEQVFGYMPKYVNYRADLDEIRNKMGNYSYLTVTYSDKGGEQIPLGIVRASDLHKPILGTVTLRDFCNREETKIPQYLEVISVIDHHKSAISTSAPAIVYITDSQSSNALVAELAFQINDRYSTGGMTLQEIEDQLKEVEKDLTNIQNKRIMQRLLQKNMVAAHPSNNSISFEREFIEYLHFLYAILDDTDLLTKVSVRDVECVASLLNRLKSLSLKKEVEVVSFDDIKRDEKFVSIAAMRILQNQDMYSLYRKVYIAKEETVEENIKLSSQGKPSSFFADTKEQNGCCRVGQTKMFAKNFPTFDAHVDRIRAVWYEDSLSVFKEQNEVDLYLHMISTVPGADDLFAGRLGEYKHQDEIWLWIPSTEPAIEHLKAFLNAFGSSPKIAKIPMEVEFLGDNAKELDQIFTESFMPVKKTTKKGGLPIAVLRFAPGMINSRKALISPFLPRL